MSVGYGELCSSRHGVKLIMRRVLDHVDLKALAKRGIRLGNTPDVLTESGMCECARQAYIEY